MTESEIAAKVAALLELRARIDARIKAAEQMLNAKAQTPAGMRGAAQCGTDSGYYRHRRTLHEPACDACRMAHAAAEKQRRNRARIPVLEAA